MPTGALATTETYQRLIAFALKYDIILVHDNPYSFILNDKPHSILSYPNALKCCIELNSLSKSHNMAGWRVGMLCANAQLIQTVLTFKSNMDSGMFLPLQMAAVQALSLDKDWHAELNFVYTKRRNIVYQILEELQCSFNINQVGMFVWAKISKPKLSHDNAYGNGGFLSDYVLDKANVFITPGGIFGSEGNNFIRVSLCSNEDVLQQALRRIKTIKN
jgi:aspartate/methionine/tyrosine aminotransferase